MLNKFKRLILEIDIAGWERDLESIAKQRKDDLETEKIITHELAKARRRLVAISAKPK